MSESKNSSALDPSFSPGGLNEHKFPLVRRINNMPLYVGIGAVLVVLIVFLYVIMDRANKQKASLEMSSSAPDEEATKNITKSTLSYNEIVSGVIDGLIPPENDQGNVQNLALEDHINSESNSLADSKPLEDTEPPADMEGAKADPLDVNPAEVFDGLDERQREHIAQAKAQRIEAAIYADTSVDVSAVSRQSHPEAGSRGDTNKPMDDYRNKLAKMKSFLDKNGAGGNVSDFGKGGSEEADPNFLSEGQNNWRLGSTRKESERFSIKSGGIIPAVMISGINSDLAGQVIAQVSENIYDTASGYDLLIPQGTRLIGFYNSDVLFGQNRVMLRWDRLIFPDASTLDLKGMAGADQMGYSGFKDKVNNHYWRLFGNAFMLSLVSAAYQQSLPDENNNNVNNVTTAQEQVAISMAENFNEVGTELIRKNLNVQPTIEIRPGYKFNVMINKDIVFNSDYTKIALRN